MPKVCSVTINLSSLWSCWRSKLDNKERQHQVLCSACGQGPSCGQVSDIPCMCFQVSLLDLSPGPGTLVFHRSPGE